MDEQESAQLEAGRGLIGNANQGGRRQVIVIDWGAWQGLARELGAEIDPSKRRANLMLEGVPLADSRGLRLNIGETIIVINGEARPCERMDEVFPGLQEAMRSQWRGGIYGEVVQGGTIRRGDPVTVSQ